MTPNRWMNMGDLVRVSAGQYSRFRFFQMVKLARGYRLWLVRETQIEDQCDE